MAAGDGEDADDGEGDGDAGTPVVADGDGSPGDPDPVGTTVAQPLVSAPTVARHAAASGRNRDQRARGVGASRRGGPTAS
jgi:hypothetical protein